MNRSIQIVSVANDANIVTHDGSFHADEVFACACLLRLKQTESKKLYVRRTRDPHEILWAMGHGVTVVDVGGDYNATIGVYDHHQKGGAGGRANGVPYSSFGLLWKDYGHLVVACCVPAGVFLSEEQCRTIASRIDDGLITTVDATDNGAVFGFQTLRNSPDVRIPQYSVSLMVHQMNPAAFGTTSAEEYDDAFRDAVEFAAGVLRRDIEHEVAHLVSETRVTDAIMKVPGAKILVLDRFEPAWGDVAVSVPGLLYCVFPDQKGTWMVQQIAKTKGSFEGRAPLPAAWAGLREQQLAALTGVADSVFCHNGRFIAGARSKEGAIALAALAVTAVES